MRPAFCALLDGNSKKEKSGAPCALSNTQFGMKNPRPPPSDQVWAVSGLPLDDRLRTTLLQIALKQECERKKRRRKSVGQPRGGLDPTLLEQPSTTSHDPRNKKVRTRLTCKKSSTNVNRKRGIQHKQIQTPLPLYRDGPSWGIFISRPPGQSGGGTARYKESINCVQDVMSPPFLNYAPRLKARAATRFRDSTFLKESIAYSRI